jgi:hypothetical protein
LLGPCLHDDDAPFVFNQSSVQWENFRAVIADGISADRTDIRIVGSARFGFSLKPWRNLDAFRATSDIDIVVVNTGLFDALWLALLAAVYPKPPTVAWGGGWLEKIRGDIYTGWIRPPQIRLSRRIVGPRADAVLEFKSKWFNTLKLASQHPPRRHEDIQGRLYRTWRHAELYHLHSLGLLRQSLAE